MSFIRPAARARLWRWREALVGVLVALWGLWLVATGLSTARIFGAVLLALGAAVVVAGWQRARFRRGRGGAGVVEVTEGQVAYFGPLEGGVLASETISAVVLVPQPHGAPVWELRSPGTGPLRIPADAEGADALFDVFETLPGLRMEPLLAALEAGDGALRILWTRPHARLH